MPPELSRAANPTGPLPILLLRALHQRPPRAPCPLHPLLPQGDANTIFSFLVAKALQVNKRLIFKFPITIETSGPPTASQGRVDNCSDTQHAASSFPPQTWLRCSWIFIIYFIIFFFNQRETIARGHSLFRAAEHNKHQARADRSPSNHRGAMSNFTACTRLPGERMPGTLAVVLGRTQRSTTDLHFLNPVPPWGRGMSSGVKLLWPRPRHPPQPPRGGSNAPAPCPVPTAAETKPLPPPSADPAPAAATPSGETGRRRAPLRPALPEAQLFRNVLKPAGGN